MKKRKQAIERRHPERRGITVTVGIDRETVAALRHVKGFIIRSDRDARDVLEGILEGGLEDIVAEFRERNRARPLEGRSVDDLDLSVRAANVLQRAGIGVIRELAALSEGEIRKLANSSAKVAREVAAELDRFGVGRVRRT